MFSTSLKKQKQSERISIISHHTATHLPLSVPICDALFPINENKLWLFLRKPKLSVHDLFPSYPLKDMCLEITPTLLYNSMFLLS